ncbi:ATP-binding protein [Atopomonas sediminilitoris]|uniref:ATP-binding protein n=1 Tax=Atopomonas sediminilitoris TaxID=2919919 RepID=UPI001F4D4A2C|nr:ATP-binding protein [Atopomonas sediminilitoris]MCJ8169479.1 ATP-binding protein [Atopomonas sediminilitoris]
MATVGMPTLASVLQQINLGVVLLDAEARVHFWNDFMAVNSGTRAETAVGQLLFELCPEVPELWIKKKLESVFTLENMAFSAWQQRPHLFDFAGSRPITGQAQKMFQNATFFPLREEGGAITLVCLALTDATDIAVQQLALAELNQLLQAEKDEQTRLIKRLEETQAQLLQSEKMAAIGQLAAGVAHEINNPVGFVNSNLGSLKGYFDEVFAVLTEYQTLIAAQGNPELDSAVQALNKKADVDFLTQDIAELIRESQGGLDRVKRIVVDLRDFSHVDSSEWNMADLHHGLDSTLNVIWNEIKYRVEIIKEYGDIPAVEAIGAQLNQVFMNLIINASHAVGEGGHIWLRTGTQDGEVFVEVRDDGCGIDPDNLNRLFEPFFTTKPVGKGTGLGLSLAYSIINKHHGRLTVDSVVGEGSRFTVWLPQRQPAAAAEADA